MFPGEGVLRNFQGESEGPGKAGKSKSHENRGEPRGITRGIKQIGSEQDVEKIQTKG